MEIKRNDPIYPFNHADSNFSRNRGLSASSRNACSTASRLQFKKCSRVHPKISERSWYSPASVTGATVLALVLLLRNNRPGLNYCCSIAFR